MMVPEPAPEALKPEIRLKSVARSVLRASV
jgi:hypothetical protein